MSRPSVAEVTVRTDGAEGPDASVDRIVSRLEELGYLAPSSPPDGEAAYTEDEESEVTDRLRDLGYL